MTTDALDVFRLDGQVAVVTGAGNGIGAATAAVLIARGAQIVGFDRHGPDFPVAAFHAFDQALP